MAVDLVIENAVAITPAGPVRGSIVVDGGLIVAVGEVEQARHLARQVIDAESRTVLPGLIDPHVHFGFGDAIGDDTMVEDFKRNTKDALLGGVTTLVTTTMIGRDPLGQLFDRAVLAGQGHSFCDYKVTCVVGTAAQAAEIPAVRSKGGVSFKFFTGYIGEQAERLGMNAEGITPDLFMMACEYLKAAGPPTFAAIHAEEPYVRGVLIDRLRRDADRVGDLLAWADTTPNWAESAQICTYGMIAEDFGVPLYPVHISSGYTTDTLRYLQRRGMPVVGETLAYFLSSTAEEMHAGGVGGRGKIQPPIRHDADRAQLWGAVADGTISVIGTDSHTFSSKAKEGTDFWECRIGLNMQFADMLPLVWHEGVNSGHIDVGTLAKVLSENAARRLGLFPRKGAIQVGSDADLVVIDPDQNLTLGVDRYHGNADYSLWEGKVVKGAPVMTFLRGELVMLNGDILAGTGSGRHLL